MSDAESEESQKIFACIDGSSLSKSVCDYAAWISKEMGVQLALMHSIEHEGTPAVADLSGSIGLGSREYLLEELTEIEQQRSKASLQKGKLMLEAAKDRVVSAGIESPVLKQRHGNLVESLAGLEAEISLLVLGIRGEDHENTPDALGQQIESIARELHRPLLVVNSEFNEPKSAMLAYDGSTCARKALDYVVKSQLFQSFPFHIVHVCSDTQRESQNESSSDLLRRAELILSSAGVDVHAKMLSGKPGDALCDYQTDQNIDLTIMGAFSHNRLREFLLGSFTEKMLLAAKKPLLLLR